MCCDAFSRQAIVSSTYTVHMLGEGGSLTHTFRHTCCNTSTHALSEPKGIKGSSLLKESPIRAVVYWHLLGMGRKRKRVCGWLVVVVMVGRMQVIVRILI